MIERECHFLVYDAGLGDRLPHRRSHVRQAREGVADDHEHFANAVLGAPPGPWSPKGLPGPRLGDAGAGGPVTDSEITSSPTPDSQRLRLTTIFGVNGSSRPHGTSIRTAPTSVCTVLDRCPSSSTACSSEITSATGSTLADRSPTDVPASPGRTTSGSDKCQTINEHVARVDSRTSGRREPSGGTSRSPAPTCSRSIQRRRFR